MNEKPDEIYRSEQVEKLKSNLSSLKANLNQLDLDLTTGVEKITEHCCELRRLVQLSTEEKILEINRFNETFIERINQYEKETKEKYLNKKVDPTRVNELNEVVKSFIEKTNEYLNDFKIDDKQVNIAFCEAELHKKSICDEIKYRKTILFDDNLMTFEINDAVLSSSILGKMKFQTIVSLNQNRIAEDENSIITEYVTDSDDDREVSENETDEENEDDIENDFEEEDEEEEEENEHTNYIEIDDPDYSNYEAEEEEVESLNDDEIDDDYENDEDDYNNDEQDYDNDEDDYEDDDDIDDY